MGKATVESLSKVIGLQSGHRMRWHQNLLGVEVAGWSFHSLFTQ
jgi:hypothetical protein